MVINNKLDLMGMDSIVMAELSILAMNSARLKVPHSIVSYSKLEFIEAIAGCKATTFLWSTVLLTRVMVGCCY